jgi:hypothetical protein
MEIFRVSTEHVLLVLANSLLGDDCVHLPRLAGSEYCVVKGYMEWWSMELIIVIRFGQWIPDFAEPLFQDMEGEYMDMLATLVRALEQWRLVLKRGNSEAWRAYANGTFQNDIQSKSRCQQRKSHQSLHSGQPVLLW